MILTVTPNPSIDVAVFVSGNLRVSDRNVVQSVQRHIGGKGANVARTFAHLGGVARAAGFLGGPSAAEFSAALKEDGVENRFTMIEGAIRINFSIEDESGSPPTQLNDPGPTVLAAEVEHLLESLPALAEGTNFVTLNGSLPKGLPSSFYARIIESMPASCRIGLDADGEPFHEGIAAHPFFVKPNEKEASRLLGRSVETDEEAIGAAREILPLMSAGGFVLLSRGEKGAVLACESGTWMGRSPKVEVQSTVGCGDAMLAGMVWALSTGSELPDAFQWSLATGAAVATTRRATIEGAAMVKDLCPQAEVTRI